MTPAPEDLSAPSTYRFTSLPVPTTHTKCHVSMRVPCGNQRVDPLLVHTDILISSKPNSITSFCPKKLILFSSLGFTHPDRVNCDRSFNRPLLVVIEVFIPSNTNAPPYFPDGFQIGPVPAAAVPRVPLLPYPLKSLTHPSVLLVHSSKSLTLSKLYIKIKEWSYKVKLVPFQLNLTSLRLLSVIETFISTFVAD